VTVEVEELVRVLGSLPIPTPTAPVKVVTADGATEYEVKAVYKEFGCLIIEVADEPIVDLSHAA